MRQKLFVLSSDAMIFEDLELLKTLPNYKKYLSNCSMVENVKAIYPSVTYPCHATMATGMYPNKHGITSNFDFEPSIDPMPWNWFADKIKTDDIFTAAKKAGLKTAGVFWPVTGNHPDIDYLIAEYWTQNQNETLYNAFKRAGSDDNMLEIIDRHKDIMVERTHPMCDNFIVNCASDILEEYKPDLFMIHLANIDDYRHKYGLFNEVVDKGIVEVDNWIGQIFRAAEKSKILDQFNFVLTSDHGQIDIKRTINLNNLLLEKGYLKTDENNELLYWQVFCLGIGTSAHVYIRDKSDKSLYKEVESLLIALGEKGMYGFNQVFDEKYVVEKYNLSGDFSFVLETDGYTSFGSSWKLPLITNEVVEDYRYGKATHGHLPEKGPQPFFLATGPGFKKNVRIKSANLVDGAPTYAKLLNIDLPDADGKPIDELLI